MNVFKWYSPESQTNLQYINSTVQPIQYLHIYINTISILLPYMYNNSIMLTALFLHWSGSSCSWTEYILKCKPSITEPLIPQVKAWMELYELAKENLAAVNRIAVCLLSSMLHVLNLTARSFLNKSEILHDAFASFGSKMSQHTTLTELK